jgi:hypothetical protein
VVEIIDNLDSFERDSAHGICPLCGEEIALDLPERRVPAKWQGVLAYRDKWSDAAQKFRSLRSLDRAADELSLSPDAARLVLEFLCLEVCGCRASTCVSCLDDYRADL